MSFTWPGGGKRTWVVCDSGQRRAPRCLSRVELREGEPPPEGWLFAWDPFGRPVTRLGQPVGESILPLHLCPACAEGATPIQTFTDAASLAVDAAADAAIDAVRAHRHGLVASSLEAAIRDHVRGYMLGAMGFVTDGAAQVPEPPRPPLRRVA